MYNIYHKKILSAERTLHIDLICNAAPSWSRRLAEVSKSYIFIDAQTPDNISYALAAKPTAIVFGGGYWNKETQEICNPKIKKYLKKNPNCLTFAYWGDGIVDSINQIDSSFINVVFCAFDEAVSKFQEKNTKAEFAPHPVDTNIFYPQNVEEIYDWCFIGTNYGIKRRQLVNELKNISDKYIIRGLGYDPPEPFSSYEETALIFNQSKVIININDDEYLHLNRYFSDRLPMAMCAGKLVLTPYQKGIEELFQKEVHLDWYKDIEELKEKLKYYLHHKEKRKKIGKCAYELVNSEYSLQNMIPLFFNRALWHKEKTKMDTFDPYYVGVSRSGCHWLRINLEGYTDGHSPLSNHLGCINETIWEMYARVEKGEFKGTHDMNLDFQAKDVIYLYRNPIDVVFSNLKYDLTPLNDRKAIDYYTNVWIGSIQKWLWDENFTINKIVICYELLKQDFVKEFSKLLTFMKLPIDEKKICDTQNIWTKKKISEIVHDKKVINLEPNYEEQRSNFIKEQGRYILDKIPLTHKNLWTKDLLPKEIAEIW